MDMFNSFAEWCARWARGASPENPWNGSNASRGEYPSQTLTGRWRVWLREGQRGRRGLDRRTRRSRPGAVFPTWFTKPVDAAQATGVRQPARLPDGTAFATWERPLQFSKTYYVLRRRELASGRR